MLEHRHGLKQADTACRSGVLDLPDVSCRCQTLIQMLQHPSLSLELARISAFHGMFVSLQPVT